MLLNIFIKTLIYLTCIVSLNYVNLLKKTQPYQKDCDTAVLIVLLVYGNRLIKWHIDKLDLVVVECNAICSASDIASYGNHCCIDVEVLDCERASDCLIRHKQNLTAAAVNIVFSTVYIRDDICLVFR